jgi:imidazoleglycerol-phosphate dehydratase
LRNKKVKRKTKETDITVDLELDGKASYRVDVPEVFLKHMLETLSRHSGFDLKVRASGDIDHHLIEDVAITLGAALRETIADSEIARIGTATVPMDDALVSVHVDLVDRPFVHIELEDVMYEHFLRSFAHEARITLHTQVHRGRDQHHITEATFKALARALREATRPAKATMSTKEKVDYEKSGGE